ncbi:hypothetical protein H9M94_00325 [Mycoplasma sp. Pen4]|uniref:hypothetical protein n=1 Tax=Mycoplasma sp. Pen4 TaxID=640330 RepID=UPI001654200A|nr:hypothetical protein [Mycoplasma sp. Pen4]QNM93711.1 hypothetical protein H9M94_00325 [Mycoplasma sp. Pen4]
MKHFKTNHYQNFIAKHHVKLKNEIMQHTKILEGDNMMRKFRTKQLLFYGVIISIVAFIIFLIPFFAYLNLITGHNETAGTIIIVVAMTLLFIMLVFSYAFKLKPNEKTRLKTLIETYNSNLTSVYKTLIKSNLRAIQDIDYDIAHNDMRNITINNDLTSKLKPKKLSKNHQITKRSANYIIDLDNTTLVIKNILWQDKYLLDSASKYKVDKKTTAVIMQSNIDLNFIYNAPKKYDLSDYVIASNNKLLAYQNNLSQDDLVEINHILRSAEKHLKHTIFDSLQIRMTNNNIFIALNNKDSYLFDNNLCKHKKSIKKILKQAEKDIIKHMYSIDFIQQIYQNLHNKTEL